MGKLVVTEFVSLDGVFEDPGGAEGTPHGGWTFKFDQGDGMQFKLEELRAADAQLLGRKTYTGFAAAWPNMNDEEFGQKMNAMPKFVVSTTLTEASWNNTEVISGDLAAAVDGLKERFEGDILVAGSGTLVRSLLDLGLVDEIRLMVHPVVLGSGRKLFDGAPTTTFTTAEARQTGAVVLVTLRTTE